MRGIMDPPRVVEVNFPAASVMECDLIGWATSRARGLIEYPQHFHGRMTMHGAFDIKAGNVFSATDDDVFLAIRDGYHAIFIYISKIASTQPAILQNL